MQHSRLWLPPSDERSEYQRGRLSANDCASNCLPDLGRAMMSQPPGDLVLQPRLSRCSASSGGKKINKFPETTEQQQCGLVASKRMCQVAFHEMILWNSVENEFTSCFVPLVYLWHTIFFPRAWKVLLNWGARSCSLLLDSYCCNLSVKTSSDKIGNTNFVGNTNVI